MTVVTPAEIGIGMRISIHPHTDDFVPVILGALAEVPADGLQVETGPVSTYVGVASEPAARRLAEYARDLLVTTADRGGEPPCHIVAHVLLSRGCPGEASCDLTVRELPREDIVELEPTGIRAVAAWSLYPLDDSGASHMEPILTAIDDARSSGLTVTAGHFATELDGDLAVVLAVMVNAWARAGAEVAHVVSHATISLFSPSLAVAS